MQYQVVCGQSFLLEDAVEELERCVERLCQEGWRPLGGISIAFKNYETEGFHYYCYACQAMVK